MTPPEVSESSAGWVERSPRGGGGGGWAKMHRGRRAEGFRSTTDGHRKSWAWLKAGDRHCGLWWA